MPQEPAPSALPSAAIDAAVWSAAHEGVVAFLRELIRIPSINPPDPPGAELAAAMRIADELRAAGLRPDVIEPVPGRGSVVARLRGDGTGGEPLLLLSHLDVVGAIRPRTGPIPRSLATSPTATSGAAAPST